MKLGSECLEMSMNLRAPILYKYIFTAVHNIVFFSVQEAERDLLRWGEGVCHVSVCLLFIRSWFDRGTGRRVGEVGIRSPVSDQYRHLELSKLSAAPVFPAMGAIQECSPLWWRQTFDLSVPPFKNSIPNL